MTDQPTPAAEPAPTVEPIEPAQVSPEGGNLEAAAIPVAAPIPATSTAFDGPEPGSGHAAEAEPVAAPIPAVPPSLSAMSSTPIADLVAASTAVRTPSAPIIIDQRQVFPGNVGVATQVANPRRTTWRTFTQALIGILVVAVPLANAVLANVNDFLHSQTYLVVSPKVYVIVNGALLVIAFIIALVARIMAVPGVASFIATYLPALAPARAIGSGRHELT